MTTKEKKLHKFLGNRRNIILLAACVLMFILLTTTLIQKRAMLDSATQRLQSLNDRLAAINLDNDKYKSMLQSDISIYVEQKAREDLDMVKPGERVYIFNEGK